MEVGLQVDEEKQRGPGVGYRGNGRGFKRVEAMQAVLQVLWESSHRRRAQLGWDWVC